MTQVGVITEQVIQVLGLNVPPNTPIYLGESNIAHMESVHFRDYQLYSDLIEDIISAPTYVGYRKGSIEYVKELSEYVKIAVRVTSVGSYFVRTLYTMKPEKVEKLVGKGSLLSLT